MLRGDERTSCLVETAVLLSWLIPAASSDAGGCAQPQPVLLSELELGRLYCFIPLPSVLCPGKAGKGEPRGSQLLPGWVATTPLTLCPSCLCRCAGSLLPRLVLRAGSPVSSAECRVSAASLLPSSCAGVVGWGPPPPLP